MLPIPAPRLYLLLVLNGAIAAVGVIGIDPAQRLEVGLSILVGLNLILLLVAWWDGARAGANRVTIAREVAGRLSIGRDNPVTLTITSQRQAAELQIYDHYPARFQVSQMPLRVFIPAQSQQSVTYTVCPDYRGQYQWQQLQVRQLGVWQLAWWPWSIARPHPVAVYPDLMGLRSLSIKLALQSTGSIRQSRRLGIGTEFAELREYAVGDDPRLIDWKATARRSHPLVRVLEPEQEQTLIILLDRGRLMTAQVQGLARFDWGLNATLALALTGLNRGDRVGVGVFDRTVHTWIPPARGQQQLPRLIERLTPIQPELLESDYLNAVTTVVKQQQRRALVVVITDLVDTLASAELLSALARLRPRYLPFCVTLRDPQVDRQAHAPTHTLVETYQRAVALDLLTQRQVAFATLKQRGVLVLDAPAHQITDQLVESYLRIKIRSQL